MAKKPLRIYKPGPEGAKIPQTVVQRRAAQVYRNGDNADRLSITQEVREHPELQRIRTREAVSSKFDALFHSIYDAVLLTDLTGNINDANARAEITFLWNKEKLCRMNIVDLISGADEELLKVIRRNVNDKKYTLLEAICLREDGSRFYAEIVVNRLHSEEQKALCFFVRDISARKQTEAELARVNEQLVQAEKIQARLDTITTLWYELNNPLQILTCMAELDNNKEYKKQLNRIMAVLEKLRNQESLDVVVDETGESRYAIENKETAVEETECNADKMLVVDDEVVLRDIFVTALKAEFPYITIEAASNGEEGFEKFKKELPALVIMDVSMPGTDGEKAFEMISDYCQKNHIKMPAVLFCTGFVISENIQRIVGDGSYHSYLRKPLTMSDLIDAVKKRLTNTADKKH